MHAEDPDLKLFRDTTRRFLAESGASVRAMHASDVAFDRTWWTRAAELGWTAFLAPPDLGGGGITDNPVADLALVAREIGRHGPATAN